jgi:hypothetical protein
MPTRSPSYWQRHLLGSNHEQAGEEKTEELAVTAS